MQKNKIVIKGAKEHNLKNINLEIPRNKFVVFTGLSGSGKSSLAFDTIYAEGQRRYVESLSSYARQFLGQMEKPNVDFIEGLSPTISIDQKTTNHNPRSTVGTVTEIYDYLRLLFARIGILHCHVCGKKIEKQTVDQIVDKVLDLPQKSKLQILAPIVRNRKGEHIKILEDAKKNGFVRARIDGVVLELESQIKLQKNKKHTIEIVVDRIIIKEGIEKRLSEAIEISTKISNGIVIIECDGKDSIFSQNFSCIDCGINLEEIEPRSFSFNNPSGACQQCSGLGNIIKFDIDLIIPDKNLSLIEGAINAPGWKSISQENSMTYSIFKSLSQIYDFDLNQKISQIEKSIFQKLMYGEQSPIKVPIQYEKDGNIVNYTYAFEGVIENLNRRYKDTSSDYMRREYESLMTYNECPSCKGQRLRPEVLAVKIDSKNITDITKMSIENLKIFFETLKLNKNQSLIAEQILKEIKDRVGFLVDVGLDYLTLGRAASTLSGGESQRIRLATQIGSGLVGVVYILDEPSIGLHQRDNDKLIKTLLHLRDLGNTLIVVEHDSDTMKIADYIVDIGPYAGKHGGEIVFCGSYEEILKCEKSLTGAYLSNRKTIDIPKERKSAGKDFIRIKGACENNLKDIDVDIPLEVFTCITGVSGSGKSTLINQILYKKLFRELNRGKSKPGKHKEICGIDKLDKVINIDQSPIGRTPRSNPATYTGVFDLIRDIFCQTKDAKIRGYQKGRFSFNVKGGRCDACNGDGIIKIEMHFLPDVYVPCEICKGKRYNRETLEVKYKDRNIYEILDMTVEEACTFFDNIPKIKEKLQALYDVGLSYIKLGQPSSTLSGGEAQRIKLATELSKKSTGKTVYVLDEPTTGLHIADVHKLIFILQKLRDSGNTVIVIEHNLDLIKTCDYIIDLGPEGGNKGGEIVFCGTPEEIIKSKDSYTGKYLKDYF